MYTYFYKWNEYSLSKLEPLCLCVLGKFMITPKGRLEGICVTGIGLLSYFYKKKKKKNTSSPIILTKDVLGASGSTVCTSVL